VNAAEAAPSAPQQPVAYGSPFDGLAISPPVPAPPVSLRDYRGDPVTLSEYEARGDAVLLTFLSTDCPGICAQVASGLHESLAAMPAVERRRLEVIAISTDPRHDSRTRVAAFLRRYGRGGRMQYLTGSAVALRRVWREWGISVASEPIEPSGASAVYAIAPSGAVMTQYSAFFTPQQIVHDVKRMAAS
jgi:protein SCO1/2